MRSTISRREMLSMAASAGGLLIVGGGRDVRAQSAKRIEQMMPELNGIISMSEPIRELAAGYGGDIGPAEGPVWIAEGHYRSEERRVGKGGGQRTAGEHR